MREQVFFSIYCSTVLAMFYLADNARGFRDIPPNHIDEVASVSNTRSYESRWWTLTLHVLAARGYGVFLRSFYDHTQALSSNLLSPYPHYPMATMDHRDDNHPHHLIWHRKPLLCDFPMRLLLQHYRVCRAHRSQSMC